MDMGSTFIINQKEYTISSIIAKGGQGIVYDALTPEGKHVCIKEIYGLVAEVLGGEVERKEKQQEEIQRELSAAQHLRGNNRFVELLDAGYNIFDSGIHRFCFVMERAEGKTLEQHVVAGTRYTGEEAAHLLRETLLGLADLHNIGLVHRDVTPSNILRSEHSVKFLDLGALGDIFAESQSFGVGKFGYVADEVLAGSAVPASDIYSLGKTMYRVLTGRDITTKKDLSTTDFAPLRTVYGDGLTDIIVKMCKPKLSERYTTTYQVLDDLTVGHVTLSVVLAQDTALVAADQQRTSLRGYLSRLLTYPILGNAPPSTRRDFETYFGAHNFNADDAAKVSLSTNGIFVAICAVGIAFYSGATPISSLTMKLGTAAVLFSAFDMFSREKKGYIKEGFFGIGNLLSLIRPMRQGLLNSGNLLEEKIEEVVPDAKSIEGKMWELGKIKEGYGIGECVALVHKGMIYVVKKRWIVERKNRGQDITPNVLTVDPLFKPFPYQTWTYHNPNTNEKLVFQPEPHFVEIPGQLYLQFYNNSPQRDLCGPALMAKDGSYLGGRSDWENIRLLFSTSKNMFAYAILSNEREDIIVETRDTQKVVFSARGRFKWHEQEYPYKEYMCFTETDKTNPQITRDIVVDINGKRCYTSPEDEGYAIVIGQDSCRINGHQIRKVTRYNKNYFYDEELRTEDSKIVVSSDNLNTLEDRIASFNTARDATGDVVLAVHYANGKHDNFSLKGIKD